MLPLPSKLTKIKNARFIIVGWHTVRSAGVPAVPENLHQATLAMPPRSAPVAALSPKRKNRTSTFDGKCDNCTDSLSKVLRIQRRKVYKNIAIKHD